MNDGVAQAAAQLNEAAAASKCWRCGCLHNSLAAIERALPEPQRPPELNVAILAARQRLTDVKYDCLGCEICFPALALNALEVQGETCPADEVEEREGWPPLPGSYVVVQYHASVAVCTLTDDRLMRDVATQARADIALVGTIQTENLGIERLLLNILANPNVRFLIVCGADSRQAVGHLPGQSLVALARSGLDEQSRIVGAHGKRPFLRNIERDAVEHFRRTVEVVDLVGHNELPKIEHAVRKCAAQCRGPAEPYAAARVVTPLAGYLPDRTISDPAGYFVVYVDRGRRLLSLEHYRTDGVLDAVIEGRAAAELYAPAIEKQMVTRLDHAAYLGRELARAEESLLTGEPYVQDAAPEIHLTAKSAGSHCGCDTCDDRPT